MSALVKEEIRRLISRNPPLVEGCVDLETQLQVNGIDLTVREVSVLRGKGCIGVSNEDRVIPEITPLDFGETDYLELEAGAYVITFNEVVHLQKNIMALGRPRSSLLRCGVTVGTAVWDAGYEGRSRALLVVHNQDGFRLQKNARVMQLVFFYLNCETDGYSGVYQNENL